MTLSLSKVQQILINHSWNLEEKDPKVVYNLIVRAILKISEEIIRDLVRELSCINRLIFVSI